MKQTTETESGTVVTVDTNSATPRLTINHEGGVVVIYARDLDAIHAIRSGLSRMIDATKARGPTNA